MSALEDLIMGNQMGNQMAQTASQGMLPSGSQPKGSPQIWLAVVGPLQTQIAGLNKIADDMRRIGGEEANERVLDIIGCTKDLQGMLVDIQKQIQEATQGQPGQQAA
jgi:hypothetical protein